MLTSLPLTAEAEGSGGPADTGPPPAADCVLAAFPLPPPCCGTTGGWTAADAPPPVPADAAPPVDVLALVAAPAADGGAASDEVYFLGVIDILQQYDLRKRGETFLKSWLHPLAGLSSVPPAAYAQRFVEFIAAHTC